MCSLLSVSVGRGSCLLLRLVRRRRGRPCPRGCPACLVLGRLRCWRGCAGVAVAGAAWRCPAGLGLLRWGCVWRGLLALLGFLRGPVRGCGWRVPGLARRRSAVGPAGGAAGGAFARGARARRRPGVGRVLVSVLARVAWLARCGPGGCVCRHPGRRLLLRVGFFSARPAAGGRFVGAGARWSVCRRLRLGAGRCRVALVGLGRRCGAWRAVAARVRGGLRCAWCSPGGVLVRCARAARLRRVSIAGR